MESEEINKALHRYVLAVLRARDSCDGLSLMRAEAFRPSNPPAERDAIPDDDPDESGPVSTSF
jgi:hypothetical protein